MSFATKQQLKELAAYMASQINVPTIGIGGGYAPIGTIIQYMGVTAPQDYLICDGTVYNIADYPQLAEFFAAQFGAANHFGGDGTTTFAVPDLRGEFLRGTGTNSHENQGSGANVGEHQDGTNHIQIDMDGSAKAVGVYGRDNDDTHVGNMDSTVTAANVRGWSRFVNQYAITGVAVFTSRPTNTSVLYCIKAIVAGEVYSTAERVVGTWIDSKKIYQKTVAFTPTAAAETRYNHGISNVDLIVADASRSFLKGGPVYWNPTSGLNVDDNAWSIVWAGVTQFSVTIGQPLLNINPTGYITFIYTKTTAV